MGNFSQEVSLTVLKKVVGIAGSIAPQDPCKALQNHDQTGPRSSHREYGLTRSPLHPSPKWQYSFDFLEGEPRKHVAP